MAEYFGVRHLSPACAHYVTEFLEKARPDTVLIEGPSDLSHLIAPLCGDDVEFPAAILAYTEKPPIRTVLWPFAEFSPEYRAMKWAEENGVTVRFCDLPSSCLLASERDDDEKSSSSGDTPKLSVYEQIEKITGTDNDSFWEYTFEQCTDYDDFIAAVGEYGKHLRENSENDAHNKLREAFMRRCISECDGRTAVITGAFHTFGIKDIKYSDEDKNITEKLDSVPVRATLMPYSYYRLSSHSGYGAGSRAPAYYEILWRERIAGTIGNSSSEYLAKIAAYQRNNGFPASAAEVIEAKRLAETLASMRGGRTACLSDLRDAAVTCMGHGSFGEISLACADTEIGTKIGSLPEGTVCTSVQEDFTAQLKELKLEKYRSAVSQEIELDLRENIRVKSERSAFLGLHRSEFMHRLRVLSVHFGEQRERVQDNATWAEKWSLQWTPESEIEIVEASLNGDTVEQAAVNVLGMRAAASEELTEVTDVLADIFLCGLNECVGDAVRAVQKLAAECTSAILTGNAAGQLSSIIRFGNIRQIDPAPVKPLLEKLFLRFCLSFPSEYVCDKQAADELIPALLRVNDACLSHDFLDTERFVGVLSDAADSNFANPLISGYAAALLTERGKITPGELSALINRRLSRGTPPAEGALWFEGFSRRNRRSLIGRLSVWEKLCGFVSELDDEEFKPVLVCLRRAFSDFSPSEKSDIAENIGEILGVSKDSAAEFITAEITADEKQSLDELDDFDFGDI